MINQLFLKNFKCYQALELELNQFNLISGINSSGKSTIIQSMLMYASHQDKKEYDLIDNRYGINFISFVDVLNNQDDTAESFIIELDGISREFRENIDERTKAAISNTAITKKVNFSIPLLYVSADRETCAIQIEKNVTKNYWPTQNNSAIGYFLYLCDTVYQNDVLSNINIHLKQIGLVKKQVTVEKSLNYYAVKVDGVSIMHVGMGIRYVLPILLTCLTNFDSIICIENPEIHLHPKAQVVLMETILDICSKNGNQIFVETHSDHILNAFRSYVKKHSEQVTKFNIMFVDENQIVRSIKIDKNGKLNQQYDNFFDEFKKQLVKLI